MGQDLIVKTTMNFIMSDEKYLGLALQVEKAMPHVRKKLLKEVKEGIKNRLEQWDENKNWEVISGTDENVFVLQRKNWPEGTEIDLYMWGADTDYLRVSLPDSIDVHEFQVAFRDHIDRPINRAANVIYQEIIDRKTEEGLKKVIKKDEAVPKLTEQIKNWAVAVDKAFGDLKEGGENS